MLTVTQRTAPAAAASGSMAVKFSSDLMTLASDSDDDEDGAPEVLTGACVGRSFARALDPIMSPFETLTILTFSLRALQVRMILRMRDQRVHQSLRGCRSFFEQRPRGRDAMMR